MLENKFTSKNEQELAKKLKENIKRKAPYDQIVSSAELYKSHLRNLKALNKPYNLDMFLETYGEYMRYLRRF